MFLLYVNPTGPELPSWTPNILRSQDTFELTGSSVGTDLAVWLRKSDGIQVRLRWAERRPDKLGLPLDNPQMAQETVTRSGYPLGSLVAIASRANVFQCYVRTPHEDIMGHLYGPKSDDPNTFAPRPFDVAREEAWFEGATRQALARVAARRLGDPATSQIKGVSVRTYATASGTKMVDLADFAAKAGFSVARNLNDQRFAFTYLGRPFVAPLAASQIKVGSNWRTLDDLIMEKDGRVLVPAGAFD